MLKLSGSNCLLAAFNDMKLKKTYAYLVMRIYNRSKNDVEIVIETACLKSEEPGNYRTKNDNNNNSEEAAEASEEAAAAATVNYVNKTASEEYPQYVEKFSPGEDHRVAFVADVKSSGSPRFAVVDHNHKLCFVAWCPETAKSKEKMMFASTKECFVEALVGLQIKIQATDDGELNEEIIGLKCISNV